MTARKKKKNRLLLLIVLIAAVLVCTGGILMIYTGSASQDIGANGQEVSWDDFEEAGLLGKKEGDIEESLGEAEYIDDVDMDGSWQFYTELASNTGSICNAGSLSLSMMFTDGDLICKGIGGNAGDMFGLEKDMNIDAFMEQMGMKEINGMTYTFSYREDAIKSCWTGIKEGRDEVKVGKDQYGYGIYIYSEGLEGAEAIDGSVSADMTDIEERYEGLKRGYDVIGPDTRVVVMLVPAEIYR